MKIIDGDRFQREHKHKILKDRLANLINGIFLTLVSTLALFSSDKLFLKLAIVIVPILMLAYVARKLFFLIKHLNEVVILGEIIQIILLALLALYILLNPIGTLAMLLQLIGGFLLIRALLVLLLTNYSIPFASIVVGLLLVLFASEIIGTVYTIFFVIMLIYGIALVTNSLYELKK